jgi:hypothetical protein
MGAHGFTSTDEARNASSASAQARAAAEAPRMYAVKLTGARTRQFGLTGRRRLGEPSARAHGRMAMESSIFSAIVIVIVIAIGGALLDEWSEAF